MISLVIPIYNEEHNLEALFAAIKKASAQFNGPYEVIAVNDGSKDGSLKKLIAASEQDPHIVVVDFFANRGQTAALSAGIDHARGDIIVTLDADMQNDPADIPLLLSHLDRGFDVVSGWRKDRKDKYLSRIVPSRIANSIISYVTGVSLHDYGCTLKVFRTPYLKGIRLYGEMHRFIPAYAVWSGARLIEVPVTHHPRLFGKTNYGISRTFRVILDLVTVKFLTRYQMNPMHFFGKFGFWTLALSGLSGVCALYLKFMHDMDFVTTPLPTLTVFLLLLAGQFILMGLLAEMMTRIYYESQGKTTYGVRKVYGGKQRE